MVREGEMTEMTLFHLVSISHIFKPRCPSRRGYVRDVFAFCEVPHASIHPEFSLLAVLRVDAGGSGVVYTSSETELHLAPEEGAGRDGAHIVPHKLMPRYCI